MTKKKTEHNVFQLIANAQAEIQQKRGSRLEKKLQRLARMQAAWRMTGIPQMWEDVKHIEVNNFAKGDLPGDRLPLANFVIPHEVVNVYDYGLSLYGPNNTILFWQVEEQASNSANPVIEYQAACCDVKTSDNLRENFVAWLAKKIEPRVIANLGYTAKEIKKADRRILVETETE